MNKKPYVIRVSSFKGGVGKTTIAINLAIALSNLNKKVLLIDADIANASASSQLGYTNIKLGWSDVLYSLRAPKDAILEYMHGKIDFLPTAPFKRFLPPPPGEQIAQAAFQVKSLPYDFIIVDTPPGYWIIQIATHYNESLIVSTLNEFAVESAKNMLNLLLDEAVKCNIVLNEVNIADDESRITEVEKYLSKEAIAVLPEDPLIRSAEERHAPALCLLNDTLKDKSNFCLEMQKLAKKYV